MTIDRQMDKVGDSWQLSPTGWQRWQPVLPRLVAAVLAGVVCDSGVEKNS